jgi:hypothetical protein
VSLLLLAVLVVRAGDPERREAAEGEGLTGLIRHPPVTGLEAGLALLALLVVGRQAHVILLRRRPRAVDVSALLSDGADGGASVNAWPALVKATLHKLGALPEPSVPNGAIQPTTLSLVEIDLPAQASAVAGALHFVLERFKVRIPYRVTTTVLPRDGRRSDPQQLVLEMLDVDTGTLVSQHRIAEPSLEIAARRAACLVYQDVTSRRGTPAWERWGEPEGASLLEFLAATEAETALDHVEALHRYMEAARAEPANAVVHLRLGNLQERQKQYAAAMETYTATLLTWPSLIQPRHRLAITMVAVAMDRRVPIAASMRRSLALLEAASGEALDTGHDRRDLLKAAKWQWDAIAEAFRWDRALLLRLRRATPIDWKTRKGIKRGPMRRNAKVASLGIDLYDLYLMQRDPSRGAPPDANVQRKLSALERRVRRMTAAGPGLKLARRLLGTGPDFRAHYNCACIYAVLLEAGGSGRAQYAKRAIEQLRHVLRTAERDQVFGWALDDQDLAPLWRLVEGDESTDIGESELAAIDLLRHQFAAGPTIRGVKPDAGGPGCRVTIRGINLDAADPSELAVVLGNEAARVIAVRPGGYDTEIEIEVPAGVEPGEVGLAVKVAGRASETRPFQVPEP